jgi:hypothetical protein
MNWELIMGCCGKISGVVGLAKSEFGIGLASGDVIDARRTVCESCDRWQHGKCMECGCYTWAKTRLTNERCPLGKWGE